MPIFLSACTSNTSSCPHAHSHHQHTYAHAYANMNSDKPACTSACTPTYMLSLVHIFSRAYPWMATLFATLLLYLHTLTSTLPHICSYVFNVTMLNQAKAQCAPAISVQTCLDDTSSLMDRDGTTILAQSGAVAGDADCHLHSLTSCIPLHRANS